MNARQKLTYQIVVLGIHKDGRPRAAAYSDDQKAEAEKAASAWKLRVGFAQTDGALALAKDLPKGEAFPSNKFDAPAIKRETYNLLCKALTSEPDGTPPPKPSPNPPAEGAPVAVAHDPWEAIKEGDVVVAQTDPEEGYFACIVVGFSKDRQYVTLKWRDYPKLPEFKAKRTTVGLLRTVR